MRFSIYNDARTADLSSVIIRESSVLSLLTHRGCVNLVLLTFYIVAPIYYVIAEYICGVSDDQTLSTGINNIYKHAGVHNTFHQAKIQFKVLLLHSVSALTKFQAYVLVHTAIRNCLTVSMVPQSTYFCCKGAFSVCAEKVFFRTQSVVQFSVCGTDRCLTMLFCESCRNNFI